MAIGLGCDSTANVGSSVNAQTPNALAAAVSGRFFGAVGGGVTNEASGAFSTVAGGAGNLAAGAQSVVAGGNSHIANGSFSAIAGGIGNTANGSFSAIAGGQANTVDGDLGFAAGRQAHSTAMGEFVWSDANGHIFDPSQEWTLPRPRDPVPESQHGSFAALSSQSAGTGYCTNGAGVLTVAATIGVTPVGGSSTFPGPSGVIPGGTWTYGALVMIVSGVGAVQVFPTNAGNGLGSSAPPASLALPATTLGALGFPNFSQVNPTITFIVADTFFGDNGSQFTLTQAAPPPLALTAPVPTLNGWALVVLAAMLAIAPGTVRRRKPGC